MSTKSSPPGRRRLRITVAAAAVLATVVTLFSASASQGEAATSDASGLVPLTAVVPLPSDVRTTKGVAFDLESDDAIYATSGSADATAAASFLAGLLRTPTGFALPVRALPAGKRPNGIVLALGGNNAVTAAEGYQLDVASDSVTIQADDRGGLFNGIETLRQLLPVKVERAQKVSGPWLVQGGTIADAPRFGYRGAMLDVARHFLPVDGVTKYIDAIARYKINYLHLHLTDDAGWRIQIKSWPDLTTIGGSTGAGDLNGGFYTQADYQRIVQYAQARGVTVIPEIDGPDHAQAALASYGKLTCDGQAPDLYTGYGKSPDGELCLDNPTTYQFLDDVIGELAALTPGPYIAVGGDETSGRTQDQIDAYFGQVAKLVEKHGKKAYGWMEASGALPAATSTVEFWANDVVDAKVVAAAKAGTKVVMAPANLTYLDQKYSDDFPEYPLGQTWAGPISIQDSYNWDPQTQLAGLPASAVVGVEAPLFAETAFGIHQLETLAFPRLLSTAELGWAKASAHDWKAYAPRLAAQGPRLREARVDYYLSPEVSWPMGS
jgi:hexosaminidase